MSFPESFGSRYVVGVDAKRLQKLLVGGIAYLRGGDERHYFVDFLLVTVDSHDFVP